MKRIRTVSILATESLRNYVPKNYFGDTNLQPMSKIPGPSSLPFIGPVLHFLPGIGKYGDEFISTENVKDMHKTYGKMVRLDSMLGLKPFVLLLDPEMGEQVLRAENLNSARKAFDTLVYYRTEIEKEKFKGSRGLLVEQEAIWREFRMKVNVPLLDLKMIRKYTGQIEVVTMEFIKRLRFLRNDENMITENISDELNKWSVESICLIALGTRLGILKKGNDNPLIKRLIEANIEIFHLGFELDIKPSLWKFYPTRNFKKIMKAYADQTRISEHYIQQALVRFKTKKNADDTDLSILEKLLAIDHKAAVVMAGDMMLAGVDTVTHTTIILLYILSQNKEKQNKLRAELKKENHREYLRACIKESQRMLPIIPGNVRTTTKEHIVAGYVIPRDVEVVVCNEFLSNSESQFPRPGEFLPERWICEKTDPLHYSSAHPFSSLPFGFGSRACIGRRIAEMELEILVSQLITQFDINWVGPPPKRFRSTLSYFKPPDRKSVV